MKNRISIWIMLIFGIGFLIYVLFPASNEKRPDPLGQARMDVGNLSAALTHYQAELGENPSGTKANILKTLLGENSKKLTFINVNPKSVNSRGEFMDPWKTPYEINIAAQTNFIIRSAGPNQTFGDTDDILYDGLKGNF